MFWISMGEFFGENVDQVEYPFIGVRESKVDQRSDILENSRKISRSIWRNSFRLFSAIAMIVTNIDSSIIHHWTSKIFNEIKTYTPTLSKRNINLGNSSIMRKPIFTTSWAFFALNKCTCILERILESPWFCKSSFFDMSATTVWWFASFCSFLRRSRFFVIQILAKVATIPEITINKKAIIHQSIFIFPME